jgi:xylulose-5-phosphate/fructose-6-phosphate phosphoketolase
MLTCRRTRTRKVAGEAELKEWCELQLERHAQYIVDHLTDMPQVEDWRLGDSLES